MLRNCYLALSQLLLKQTPGDLACFLPYIYLDTGQAPSLGPLVHYQRALQLS